MDGGALREVGVQGWYGAAQRAARTAVGTLKWSMFI
jgi:hypothetical protein